MTQRSTRTILSATLVVNFVLLSGPKLNAAEPKPEKNHLEVAIAAYGPLYLPLLVAHEAGYFSKRGVNLNITQLSATASAQALISGKVDIYQGGASTIHANIGGSDLIYIGASVDRSTFVLFGQKGWRPSRVCVGKLWRRPRWALSARLPYEKAPRSAAWKSARTSSSSITKVPRRR